MKVRTPIMANEGQKYKKCKLKGKNMKDRTLKAVE